MSEGFSLNKDERATLRSVIREYSVTYYRSTLLFPSRIRDRVFVLYAWVRQADEIVDNPESDPAKTLQAYADEFAKVWEGGETRHLITLLFVRMAKELNFKREWAEAFLDSMHADLDQNRYATRADLDRYIYGSADVIGLMMARIMDVKEAGFPAARQLGSWMQRINFLRDVGQDWRLRQRVYIPLTVLKEYGLEDTKLWDMRHTWQWHELVYDEANALLLEKKEIEKTFSYLPKDCRLAVQVATELYCWTLLQLKKQPILTWSLRPVKPNKAVLATTVAWWSWKYKGAPSASKGKKLGDAFLRKSGSTLARLPMIRRTLQSGSEFFRHQ